MGDSWVVASIEHKLKSLPALSSYCSIYRVPENLRKVNEDAYRPLLVSIGPFYYNDPKLLAMQEQKLRYLQSFLRRNSSYNTGQYVEAIRGWEQVARQCYAEMINLPSENFIEMVLTDAAFIIELFRRGYFHQEIEENDRIFYKPRMIVEVSRDIRLEENQLPFFILKCLYDLAFGPSPNSFVDLAYKFLMRTQRNFPQEIANVDIKHLVDFLRLCYLPSTRRREHTNDNQLSSSLIEPSRREHPITNPMVFSPNITRLSEAGVKFKVRQTENLLDIRFKKANGVLEIPKLMVTDDTESLFRNIMVFEQCHYYFDSYIIDYFAFLGSLIDTPKDVEILVEKDIIENWVGSNKEVADLFNNFFKQTRLQNANFYYSSVCCDLYAYTKTQWHEWKAILKRDYFNHPWSIISVVAAAVLLVLTISRTVTGFINKSS